MGNDGEKSGNEKTETETSLYRHFDADGELLYVGVSLNAVARLAQHRDSSQWFNQIRSVVIERHPTREAAIEAEKAAIKCEKPKHNIIHNGQDLDSDAWFTEDRRALVRMVSYKPLYTSGEVSMYTGLSSQQIRKFIQRGQLACVHIGAKTYVTGWQLISFIEFLEETKRVKSPFESE